MPDFKNHLKSNVLKEYQDYLALNGLNSPQRLLVVNHGILHSEFSGQDPSPEAIVKDKTIQALEL
ncbi:hypothetical protein BGZ49_003777, partial [Haplosporangium sp. Z 27]